MSELSIVGPNPNPNQSGVLSYSIIVMELINGLETQKNFRPKPKIKLLLKT